MKNILRLGMVPAVLTFLCSAPAVAQGTLQNLAQFSGDRGEPSDGVIPGPGGLLWGTAKKGGHGYGSVFKIDPASPTPTLTTVYVFGGGDDGRYPASCLLLANDGNFYGTTAEGGASNFGTVFRLTPSGTLTTLISFALLDPNGWEPETGLIQASDGNLYGTTNSTVYRITLSGTFLLLHQFTGGDEGGYLNGRLVEGSDGALYGTAASGGSGGSGWGTIFRLDPASGAVTTLYSFASISGPNGAAPYGTLVRGSGGVLYGATFAGGANDGGTVFKITEAGAFTRIAALPAGTGSWGDITLGSDGNLYVVGQQSGRIVKVALDGTVSPLTTLDVGNPDGDRNPLRGQLLETSPGIFYGTAAYGGARDFGGVFRLTPGQTPVLTMIDSFGAAGGANPRGLVKAGAGGFYGVTSTGGASAYGTVFKLSAGGALTTVHSFDWNDISPAPPPYENFGATIEGVIEGSDGNLYGTTRAASGSAFKLTPGGTLTRLSDVSFGLPIGPIIEASDGNLYGMKYGYPHSVFRVTHDGTFSPLSSWGGGPQAIPIGALSQGPDGNFYGMSGYDGPTLPYGRVFRVTPAGALTTLAALTNPEPYGALVAAPDGNLYGRTFYDESGTIGSVFRVTPAGTLTTIAHVAPSEAHFLWGFASDLTLGPDGNLYGTTSSAFGMKTTTIFRLTPAGNLTTLRTFSPSEGFFPTSLVVASPRELYGAMYAGGPLGGGTVFHLTDVAPVLSSVYSPASPLVTARNTIVLGAVTASDPDDTALTFRVVSQGGKGTAVVDPATGAFTYTPAANARGRDAFSVVASDPFGDSNVATVFVSITPPPPAARDFDGDGRVDMTTYDGNGRWRILKSSTGYVSSVAIDWGGVGYVPVGGDYDGDGAMDPAVYQTATGRWLALLSSTNFTTVFSVDWGGTGYVPAPGDYDGDGRMDPGVYLRATGQWFVLKSIAGYATAMTVATSGGGAPVPGLDFDGDGASDIVVFIGSTWSIRTSSSTFTSVVDRTLGGPGVTLVAGDYDGDGKADPAVYERATGRWRVLRSSDGSILDVVSGGLGFDPVPGDYDGDGVSDVATVDRATGTWTVRLSSTAFSTTLTIAVGGASNDALISSAIPVIISDVTRASDADGDSRSDMTVYNPASGQWRSLTSASDYTAPLTTNWGGAGYTPAPGDYDGDGKADRALYQAATGKWFVLLSAANFTTSLGASAGGPDYAAVAADYDGDGKTDFAVYNTTTGLWYILKSSTNSATAINWGGAGYLPVPADFDGDGRADLALYVPASGNWHVLLSRANFTTSITKNAGGAGYSAMPGDYDGDGRADFVVYNTATGQWYGLLSSGAYMTTIDIGWGGTGYVPVKSDFDGDGRADLALYRAANRTWYVLLSGSTFSTSLIRTWGDPGDIPVQP